MGQKWRSVFGYPKKALKKIVRRVIPPPEQWKKPGCLGHIGDEKLPWVVVSKIFYVHPYLGKIPILTNIFQRGWFNHQLATHLFGACNKTIYIGIPEPLVATRKQHHGKYRIRDPGFFFRWPHLSLTKKKPPVILGANRMATKKPPEKTPAIHGWLCLSVGWYFDLLRAGWISPWEFPLAHRRENMFGERFPSASNEPVRKFPSFWVKQKETKNSPT